MAAYQPALPLFNDVIIHTKPDNETYREKLVRQAISFWDEQPLHRQKGGSN